MIKVEDIQQYGKEHLETVVASATSVQNGLQAIASAYGDYTKKSFEDTKSFVEKLSGVKSLDKALEVQTEFAKSAYETFVAESQKIAGLYTDLAKTDLQAAGRHGREVHAGCRRLTFSAALQRSKARPSGRAFSCSGSAAIIRSARRCRQQCSDRAECVVARIPGRARRASGGRIGRRSRPAIVNGG